MRLIRDAEIESIIRTYSTPLFQAAGLNPNLIHVHLIQDPSLNAFVTPGLDMFINTGLLIRADSPLEVIGVIAHETGHLTAGHTVLRGGALRNASTTVIASYILGLAAAIATGRGEFANAAISGGQDIALKGLLSYTRSQEATADTIAVRLLNGTGESPKGLLDFMRVIGYQEAPFTGRQDPYLMTHPITKDRVAFLEDQVKKSPVGSKPADPELVAMHARMRAKLIGFLDPEDRVLALYPKTDTSVPGRYARAIAAFKAGKVDTSISDVDSLIADYPDDPYFHELKGQILFENSRVREAVPEYEAAARLLPDSAQIRLVLAQARIELNDPAQDKLALDDLAMTLSEERDNAFAWRLSAIAHGRQGDTGMTALSMAESALAQGEDQDAVNHAIRAQKILAEGSPAWLRARDLELLAQRRVKRK
jgi:predicted Zn-dependent protease